MFVMLEREATNITISVCTRGGRYLEGVVFSRNHHVHQMLTTLEAHTIPVYLLH